MESKTKKATKKETIKKEVIKNDEVTIKNQINYIESLNKIFYVLIVIAVILGLNLIINIVKNADSTSNENNTGESTNTDYDVSKFETLTTTEAAEKISKGGTQVVYIGRANCGYCVKFVPILKQAQDDLGYKTIYIDLNEVTSDDKEKLVAYDSYVEENFGYTPMVLVFKDGKYVSGWVGYTELEEFKSFLADAGIK